MVSGAPLMMIIEAVYKESMNALPLHLLRFLYCKGRAYEKYVWFT